MHKMRERIRQLTRRTRGCSLEQIAEDLRSYVPGWKAYFRLAQTPKVMREMDEWLRHRLRAIQLKQWGAGRRCSASYASWGRRRTWLRALPAMQEAGGATAPWA